MERRAVYLWVALFVLAMVKLASEGFAAIEEPINSPPRYFAAGRLLDAQDRPLTGATLRPTGVSAVSLTTSGAIPAGFSEQIVPDTNGNFIVSRDKPFTRVQVHIDVPEVGSGELWLETSNTLTVIHFGPFEMNRPYHASPVPAPSPAAPPFRQFAPPVAPGALPLTSAAPAFVTAPQYRPVDPFTWTNSFATPGAWSRSTSSSQRGQVTILLSPIPYGQAMTVRQTATQRLKLAGRVQPASGRGLPGGLRVTLRAGSENSSVEPDAEGKFAFEGVPAGLVNLGLEPGMEISHEDFRRPSWTGWRFTAKNRSRRTLGSRTELVGQLDHDKEDILLVIEYVKTPMFGGPARVGPFLNQPERRELWGAEPSGPPLIILSGRVVDDSTGQPVQGLTVTAWRKKPAAPRPPVPKSVARKIVDAFSSKEAASYSPTYPDETEPLVSSNGMFWTECVPMDYLPMLRAEARGYIPFQTELCAQSVTNLIIRLKPGTGPSGIVLLPNGKPAVGVGVVLAKEGFIFLTNRQVRASPPSQLLKTAGPDGKFAFEPTFEPCDLIVAAAAGWVEARSEGANENLTLRLKPWAVLKGSLVTTNGTPAAGIALSLIWWQESDGGVRFLHELGRVTTSATGQFEFQEVPPRLLELQRSVVTPPMGWRPGVHQAWVTPKPGVTNDLGRVICDPPPTLMETFKRKIGL